jgi:hypothetical protein
VGIRGIGRVLCIAVSTVLRKIRQIAAGMAKPPIPLNRAAFDTALVAANQFWHSKPPNGVLFKPNWY